MTKSIFSDHSLIIPVGKLAIAQFLAFEKLNEVVGRSFRLRHNRCAFDLIPLPHPSGASPWHRIPPGLGLLRKAMRLIARHPALQSRSLGPIAQVDLFHWTACTPSEAKLRRSSPMSQKVLTRADLPDSDKWDLTHLFTGVDKWVDDVAWIQQTYPEITAWKGRLGESAATLAACLEFEKSLDQKIERVAHYASLQLAEDSAQSGLPRSHGPVAEPAHQNQRSRLFPRPGNPGDPRRKIRAISGGPGAGRLEDSPEENPANETTRPLGAGRTPARARERGPGWLR